MLKQAHSLLLRAVDPRTMRRHGQSVSSPAPSDTRRNGQERRRAWEKSWGLGFGLLFWLWLGGTAQAELLLRIGVATNTARVAVGSSTPARVLDRDGTVLGEVPAMTPLAASSVGSQVQVGEFRGTRLRLQPMDPSGAVYIRDRWYRGTIEVVPGQGGVTAINRVDLEDYISSVVGAEMGHRFPQEALKAQAVAARTFALFHRQDRLNEPYDLGNTQEWQVYHGIGGESNVTQAAAQTTRGQVLTHNGRLINAVFHSSSGGHTENSEDVWREPLPYLRAVNDRQAASLFPWEVTLTGQQLQRLAGDVGMVQSVAVSRRSPQGRAIEIEVVGSGGRRTLRAFDLRRQLDLRSTFFTVESLPARVASLDGVSAQPSFTLRGQGFGHGVGMSQYGAAGLAQQGYDYEAILRYYYQGVRLGVINVQ